MEPTITQPLWSDTRIHSVAKRYVYPVQVAIDIRNDYEAERATLAAQLAELKEDNERIKGYYLKYYNQMSELEAQLAQAGRWMPVEDGHIEAQHEGSYIVIDGEWLQANERILGGTDIVDTCEAEIALPEGYRLCRWQEGSEDA